MEKCSGASHLWFVEYNADLRLRSEQFEERLRWRAERYYASVGSAGSTSNYDPATVIAMARSGGMRTCTGPPIILYLTRIKPAATAVEDGTAQPALKRPNFRGRKGTLDRSPRLTQATTEVLGQAFEVESQL